MAKVKIGDIIEIKTKKGFSYAHYTHNEEDFCNLIQVKEGFYDKRPENFGDVARSPTTLITYFPLEISIKKKDVDIVTNVPVPQKYSEFPLIRIPGFDLKTGKITKWYLWDGNGGLWDNQPIKNLTEEQKKLPIRQICPLNSLVEKIETDWTPDMDPNT